MTAYLSLKLKVLSFLLIVFVVFLHSYNLKVHLPEEITSISGFNQFLQEFISFGLTRIAVPLFFFISGFLFFQKFKFEYAVIKEKLSKRFFSLFIPYLLWSILVFLFYYALQSLPFMVKYFNNELITNLSLREILGKILLNPIPYQLWFLRDLMFLVLLSPIIYLFIKNLKIVFLLILLLIWFNGIRLFVISNEAVLFFSIGAYFQLKSVSLQTYVPTKYVIGITSLWIGSILFRLILLTYSSSSFFENLYLLKLSIILGIFSVWFLYDKVIKEEFLPKLAQWKIFGFSFFLYLVHEPTLTIFKKVLFKLANSSALIYLIAPILTIITCLILAVGVSNSFPRIYGLLTGNRKQD
jgi:surface polysaccharide O-acyltransferase-like enzyme